VAVQLDNIASDLYAYAKYLDWLDEQAKKEIDRQRTTARYFLAGVSCTPIAAALYVVFINNLF
jgi:hypothetical protein